MANASYDEFTQRWLATDLDAWTRHVLRRHFDPESGSPYWLKRAAELPFDPLDITRYDELVAFGPFELDVLRDLDPVDMVPQAIPRPLTGRIWDTGGTTGRPCRIFYTEEMLHYRGTWRQWSLSNAGFLPNRTWLQAVPTGPHVVGNCAVDHGGRYESLVYGIDMDPRWIKRLIRTGGLVDAYTEHLIDQITDVLDSGRVQYLSTTPALFRALAKARPEVVRRLDGVRLSGTHVTPAMYREIVAALDDGICFLTYGNTFGNATSTPAEQGGDVLPYLSTYPKVTHAVVARADWTSTVPYGATGRVLLTVMYEDLFVPNILERDEAERYDTGGRWPWDGVANVRPLQITTAAPEGLY